MYQQQISIIYKTSQPIQTTTLISQTPRIQTITPRKQNIPENPYYISTQELNASARQTQP